MKDEMSPQENPTEQTPELRAYYGNRPLMWRNLSFILVLNLGWAIIFTVISPLMQLRVKAAGLEEGGMGLIGTINAWAYSFLVMYFAWKSDHTVSRFGRRIPYLFISAPVIILSIILFPFVHSMWLLVVLWLLQMLFMDIKAATIPLLGIDCMPRKLLARVGAPAGILTALLSFFALRYGMKVSELAEWLPYIIGGAVLIATTLLGGFLIKEPPIKDPTTEKFRPWSAMKIAWKDKRKVVLMISVSLFQTFQVVFGSWIWIYADSKLGLTRAEAGAAMSWAILLGVVVTFPLSWLVDRISPYRLLPFFCLIVAAVFWSFLNMKDINGLILTTCLQSLVGPLYSASDIMVYRTVNPAEVGSVTSTNSCLRGFYNGCLAAVTGYLIQSTGGNYHLAFFLGCIFTVAGLIPLYYYRHLMKRTGEAGAFG